MKTKTKQGPTPGPWDQIIGSVGAIAATSPRSGLGVQVAAIHEPSADEPDWADEWKANAGLIAAAPDLLETAKLAVKRFEESADVHDIAIHACFAIELRAAIAKAEGVKP